MDTESDGRYHVKVSSMNHILVGLPTSWQVLIHSHPASHQPTPSAPESPTDTESDVDAYGSSRRKGPNGKKAQRRLVQTAPNQVPAHAEVRFSTRNAAKVSNYNEDDDDEMFQEEEDTTPNYWASAADVEVPAIDAVLNHRLREDTSKQSFLVHLSLCDLLDPRQGYDQSWTG